MWRAYTRVENRKIKKVSEDTAASRETATLRNDNLRNDNLRNDNLRNDKLRNDKLRNDKLSRETATPGNILSHSHGLAATAVVDADFSTALVLAHVRASAQAAQAEAAPSLLQPPMRIYLASCLIVTVYRGPRNNNHKVSRRDPLSCIVRVQLTLRKPLIVPPRHFSKSCSGCSIS